MTSPIYQNVASNDSQCHDTDLQMRSRVWRVSTKATRSRGRNGGSLRCSFISQPLWSLLFCKLEHKLRPILYAHSTSPRDTNDGMRYHTEHTRQKIGVLESKPQTSKIYPPQMEALERKSFPVLAVVGVSCIPARMKHALSCGYSFALSARCPLSHVGYDGQTVLVERSSSPQPGWKV